MIVQRHFQAIGGRDKIDSLRSTITRAECGEETFAIPGAFIAKMQPNYKTICDPREKLGDFCEGYDGGN